MYAVHKNKLTVIVHMQYKWMFKLQFLPPYYNDEYFRSIIIARNLVQMTLSRIPVESEVNYQCNEKTEIILYWI